MGEKEMIDVSTLPNMAEAAMAGVALCAACGYVSKEECRVHMEEVKCNISEHEKRLNTKDVEDAKTATKMDMHTWLLSGILGVTFLSFLANIFKDFIG